MEAVRSFFIVVKSIKTTAGLFMMLTQMFPAAVKLLKMPDREFILPDSLP